LVNGVGMRSSLTGPETNRFQNLCRDPPNRTGVVNDDPPDKALVLCVDEKSQIQALDRTQPGLPLKSHLDVAREKAVNDALRGSRLTRIIIAHRPETIAASDRIIRLEEGRVLPARDAVPTISVTPRARVRTEAAG
jgi:hypothetical protein